MSSPSGARTRAARPRLGERSYEALGLEGHRWRFRQVMREAPQSGRVRSGER
jgi:hypothetical protein